MRSQLRPLILVLAAGSAQAEARDPRLREVVYDPGAVVSVPVRRGVVTHVELADDEAITDVGAGLGGDCARPEAVWCIAAQSGGRHLFVKPKSGAEAANNVAVVTDRRAHALRFVVLPDGDPRAPVYRLVIRPPRPADPPRQASRPTLPPPPVVVLPAPTPAVLAPALLEERLQAAPELRNSDYTIAEGDASADIVPTLVFDDGRFTYLRLPGNREVPAVFHVQGDGSEAVVNTRMEGDLLVVDRVSRRLVLRAGQAVVGVWNEAFDLDGAPPEGGTTVPGVQRRLRRAPATPDAAARPPDSSPTSIGGAR
jgi:type IV secretion system protein VirB9